MFIRVFNKDVHTPNPIFSVNEEGTMAVFGYSLAGFCNSVLDYFNVKNVKFDPNYGMHGQRLQLLLFGKKRLMIWERLIKLEKEIIKVLDTHLVEYKENGYG